MTDKYKLEMESVHVPEESKKRLLAAMKQAPKSRSFPVLKIAVAAVALSICLCAPMLMKPPGETVSVPTFSQQNDLNGTASVPESYSKETSAHESEISDTLPSISQEEEESSTNPPDSVLPPEDEITPPEYEMPNYTAVYETLNQIVQSSSSGGSTGNDWANPPLRDSKILHNKLGTHFEGEDIQVYQDRYIYNLFKGKLRICSMEGGESRLLQSEYCGNVIFAEIALYGDRLILVSGESYYEEGKCTYPRATIFIFDIGEDPENPRLLQTVLQDGSLCLLKAEGDTLYFGTAYEVQIINGIPGFEPVDLSKQKWRDRLHLPHYYTEDGFAIPAEVEIFGQGGCFTTIGGIHLETGELRFQNTVLGHSEVEFFAENTFYAITSNRMEKTLIQSFCPTDDGILPIASCTLKDTFILRKWARMGDYLCIITKPSENNSMTLNVLDAKLELIAALSPSQDDDTSYAIEFRGSTCYLTVKPIDEFEHEIVALIDLSDPANPKFLPLPEQCLATSRAITYDESRLLFFSKRTTVVNGNGTPASSITMYRMEGDLLEIECRTQKIDGFSYGDTLDNPAQYVWCDSRRKLICLLAKDVRYNEHPKTPLGYLFLSYGEDGFTVLNHIVVLESVSFLNMGTQYPNSNNPIYYRLVGSEDFLYILHAKGVIVVDLNSLEDILRLAV